MKELTHNGATITLTKGEIGLLESYAATVCKKMQKARPRDAQSWTGCRIAFNGVTPVFEYVALPDDGAGVSHDAIIVRCPVISRQRKWQLARKEQGVCQTCSAPLSVRSRVHCPRHRHLHQVYSLQRYRLMKERGRIAPD